jgi:hypothetical protein
MLHCALSLTCRGNSNARGTDEALLFSSVLASMLNRLGGRYQALPFARRIMKACGRHEILPNPVVGTHVQLLTRYIGDNHGMYFLSDLLLDKSEIYRAVRLPRVAVLVYRHPVRNLFGADTALQHMTPAANGPVDAIEWAR